ncbi:DUF6114 domain-containing protein [Micromonospora phytophila]|uniref:DUF6114 domain-containing protein n=1 Tax=Micromonospora phytophila TaxID=709888 RepID=UPI00202FE095|nr:DUF6114 domain-containing protein [Micromonospora phytophila]MCM0673443.1 DUF6114 domain-containing protein [Micromonospora phytophila]
MTAAEPQNARSGRLRQARSGFRRWRWTRPFWGGLLTALAGLEIFGTTQMSLAGLSFQSGPTGFLSWLVPAILVTCGLLMWFKPQHRMLYAVVAAVTTLFSLIGVNLGGFFVGLILGLVGSALGAGWVPAPDPTTAPNEEPAGDRTTHESTGDGAEPEESPGHRAVLSESPDEATMRNEPRAGAEPDLPTAGPGRGRSGTSRPSSTS